MIDIDDKVASSTFAICSTVTGRAGVQQHLYTFFTCLSPEIKFPSQMDIVTDLYETIHPGLVLTLCISGAIGHVLAIGVLLRMKNPTNILLVSMSCSQLILCANFLYSTAFKYGSDGLCLSSLWGFGWTSTFLVSVNLSVIVEMCGVFHVVALSIIRYVSLEDLTKRTSSQSWFTYKRCWQALAIIYGSVLFVCGPLYFHSTIKKSEPSEGCIEDFPDLKQLPAYRLTFVDDPVLQRVNFWLFGSICKLIPCSILCIMTFLLLNSLSKIRAMSARFASEERDRHYVRTTNMILIIMFIFICVEFPQGILAVAQSVTTIPYSDFLGDLFEMLTLLASCLIFALFCSMNSRLREAFYDVARSICFFRHMLHKIHKTKSQDTDGILETSSPETHVFITGHTGPVSNV